MSKRGIPSASIAQATLTPAFLAKVEQLLIRVRHVRTVCLLVGVSRRSFYHWKKVGAALRDQHLYEELSPRQRVLVDFCNAVERGLALGEVHDLDIIEAEAQKNWRAAAWRLERRAPERWGARRTARKLDPATMNQIVAQVVDALRHEGEEDQEDEEDRPFDNANGHLDAVNGHDDDDDEDEDDLNDEDDDDEDEDDEYEIDDDDVAATLRELEAERQALAVQERARRSES